MSFHFSSSLPTAWFLHVSAKSSSPALLTSYKKVRLSFIGESMETTPLMEAHAASSGETTCDHTRDSFLTRATFLSKNRLLTREPSQETSRETPPKNPFERDYSTCLAAPAAALVATILTTSTTGDPGGHDNGPHHNGSIGVASTAGSLGNFADEAGTPMVEYIGTPTASGAALAATILTTLSDPGGHDDGLYNNGFIKVASMAGSLGTFANEAGTPMVEYI